MKKILIGVIIAACFAGGYYLYKKKSSAAEIKYSTAEVVSREISEFVDTTGEVAPQNRVEIQPSAPGRIEKILVEEGDKIKSGQVLALMSSSDRVAILDAARALSEEQYQYWQEAYKPIKVVAPLNGSVILKNIVEGQTVSQSTVLFAMSDRLILTANVDESDVGKVRQGQSANIILDAYPDMPVKGTVFQILDEGKNQSNVITYTVKIRPAKVPSFFKSQMTSNIKIEVASKKIVLMVPSKAVVLDPSGSSAVITGLKDAKPIYKKVETGLEEDKMTVVKKGLNEGDLVYFQDKGKYTPQQAQGKNPLMPTRPNVSRAAGRAMH